MYGRQAISVYNNFTSADSEATFYFAQVSTRYIGRTFQVYLWDPGEGVTSMQLLAPNGQPLNFTWEATPGSDSGLHSAGLTDTLDTSGTYVTAGLNLSNDFKFNDRLVTLSVTLPEEYIDMVNAAGGTDWLRIKYALSDTPSDRTTWGINLSSDGYNPPVLGLGGGVGFFRH